MSRRAGVTKDREHRGSRAEPLTPDEFASWFDTLTGPVGRGLKQWPETMESVHVRWGDAHGQWNHPATFDDLLDAYTGHRTAVIAIGTNGAERPRVQASYYPGGDRVRVVVEASGAVNEVDEIVDTSAALFPDPIHRQLVFLSWGGEHSEGIARALKAVLEPRMPRSEVFFSSESIEVGSDPLQAMLEDGVLRATVLVVILTKDSASNPWTLWETAAAWARGAKVIPLFVNVSPSDVGGPLTIRVQGARLVNRAKLDEAIFVVARELGEPEPAALSNDEFVAVQAAERAGTGPPPETAIAEELIHYLEDRRVLYNPSEVEVAEHCIKSVFDIRRYLSDLLDRGGMDQQLSDAVRAMRAACRTFLTRIRLDHDHSEAELVHSYRRDSRSIGMNDWVLNQALGELRGAFGIHIATIAGYYGIAVDPELATILPARPE